MVRAGQSHEHINGRGGEMAVRSAQRADPANQSSRIEKSFRLIYH
jgi:hypothetical protein